MKPQHFECLFRRIARSSTKQHGDCVTITVQIHPQEVPDGLWNPEVLNKRFMVALAQIGDDELPEGEPKPPSVAREAGAMCQDHDFQLWLHNGYGNPDEIVFEKDKGRRAAMTARLVRLVLEVNSRKELDINPEKAQLWHELYNEYRGLA